MMRSSSMAALAASALVAIGGVSLAPAPAEAGWRTGYRHAPAYRYGYAGPRGYHYRGNRGLNVGLGIAAGALAIGAIAAATSPAYAQPAYGYQPTYGYAQPAYYAPRCYIQHRNVWDPYYGYVSQPVRVCR
jgi:hypothetical protein